MSQSSYATDCRTDVSKYLTHLTRDDSGGRVRDRDIARDNFRQILATKEILTVSPHGLYSRKLPDQVKKKFRVACFTGVPLNQLHQLVKNIPNRSVKLEPYGFAFSREFIKGLGAQSVHYVDGEARLAYDRIFEIVGKSKLLMGDLWKALPYVSAMHDGCDFSWEREWRIRKTVKFDYSDIKFAIIPKDETSAIKNKLARLGIHYYMPGLTKEQMAESFLEQHERINRLKGKAFVKRARSS